MKHEMRGALSLLTLSLILLSGCSLARWSTDKFVKQVARADHAVARDWYRGSILVITGQETTNLVRALGAAEGLPKNQRASTAPHCTIQFFQGTNLLACIDVQEQWFAAGEGEFLEKSGALKALQRRLESDRSARQAWVQAWARDILLNPESASLRDWSAELVRRYERGGLRVGKYDDGPTGVAIPYQEVPGWLKAPHAYIHKDPFGRPECVVLDWYHYGLVIGSTNQPTTFRAWYTTNLGAGIVAYHSGE
jgi:hypothetical protein